MRYEDMRASTNVEDRRPLQQRFQVGPQTGYLAALGGGTAQDMVNTTAANRPPPDYGYRPRGSGPERAAIQPMGVDYDPDYRPGVGPERSRAQTMPPSLAALAPAPWEQMFMQQTGIDPAAIGIRDPGMAQQYLAMRGR